MLISQIQEDYSEEVEASSKFVKAADKFSSKTLDVAPVKHSEVDLKEAAQRLTKNQQIHEASKQKEEVKPILKKEKPAKKQPGNVEVTFDV